MCKLISTALIPERGVAFFPPSSHPQGDGEFMV